MIACQGAFWGGPFGLCLRDSCPKLWPMRSKSFVGPTCAIFLMARQKNLPAIIEFALRVRQHCLKEGCCCNNRSGPTVNWSHLGCMITVLSHAGPVAEVDWCQLPVRMLHGCVCSRLRLSKIGVRAGGEQNRTSSC